MSSARRCLFGRPTPEQRAKTRAWLDAACQRMCQEQSQRWGFDFNLGIPLPNSECTYDIIPENLVPEFYRPKILSVSTSRSSLDLSSTNMTPLSSPSTSDREESLLAENSSFEEEEEPSKNWKFTEPPTPRKSPTKRQQKMTDYMVVSRKKNSLSPIKSATPSPNVIYVPKSRRPTSNRRSPY